jgi:methylated-DNA-protein-cysteine methyltransferase related protein
MIMDLEAPVYERIYNVVKQIPRGKVASYGQIARITGGCTARMVGFAMAALRSGSHPDVPWQRVINSQGKISPHGQGIGSLVQRDLLEEEGVHFDLTGRIDFDLYGWAGPSI